MNKILMSAAIAASVLSSCSKNEIVESLPKTENPNAIRFTTGLFTAKSTEVNSWTFFSPGTTVNIVSDHPSFGIGGSAIFNYTGSEWLGVGSPTWGDFGYVLSLYSVYSPINDYHYDHSNRFMYHVPKEVMNQEDLIYFGKVINVIPTNGYITATYKHALARVKMENVTETMSGDLHYDYRMVTLQNVAGSGEMQIEPVQSHVSWNIGNQMPDSYVYDLDMSDDPTQDMYIIPQYVSSSSQNLKYGLIGVTALFKAKISDTNTVGWENVEEFILDNPGVTEVINGSGTYWGPIYVKGIFPLENVYFEDGRYYNLQLNWLGESFVYAENRYYDEFGYELTIYGEHTTPETGDPIFPNADTKVGLKVELKGWPDFVGQEDGTDNNIPL